MIKCGPHGCLSLCKTQRMLKGQVVQELQSDVCWVSGRSLATYEMIMLDRMPIGKKSDALVRRAADEIGKSHAREQHS